MIECAAVLSQLNDDGLHQVLLNKRLFALILRYANDVVREGIQPHECDDILELLQKMLNYKKMLASESCLRSILKEGLTRWHFNDICDQLIMFMDAAQRAVTVEEVNAAFEGDLEEMYEQRRKLTKWVVTTQNEFLYAKVDAAISNRLFEFQKTSMSQECPIPLYMVENMVQISKTNNGVVFRGIYENVVVVVKFMRLDQQYQKKAITLKYIAREFEIFSALPKNQFVIDLLAADPISLYLVMNNMEADLAMHLKKHGHEMMWPEKLSIASQIAKGLQFLHQNNVLHCDIKPMNVLLARCGVEIIVKLADFGFSRYKQSTMNEPCGTTYFAAPEIRTDCPHVAYSEESDIYSLGVTLWQLHFVFPPTETMLVYSAIATLWREPQQFVWEYAYILVACLQSDPGTRPTIDAVISRIEGMKIQCLSDCTEVHQGTHHF